MTGESRRRGLRWVLVGVVVLLAAGVGAAAVVVQHQSSTDRAADTVRSYLTAVAEGDAEAALEYVDDDVPRTLLTQEMLDAALKVAPLTVTDVGHFVVQDDENDDRVHVSAEFTIGDSDVSRGFVLHRADGGWTIEDPTIALRLDAFNGLPLTVNDLAVADPGQKAHVFPGAYVLGFDEPSLAVDGEAERVIAEEADGAFLPPPALSEEGVTTFRKAMRAALEECLAEKTLKASCGLDVEQDNLTGGYRPVRDSVTRTLTPAGSAALDAMTPSFRPTQGIAVGGEVEISVTYRAYSGSDVRTVERLTTSDTNFEVHLDDPVLEFGPDGPEFRWLPWDR